MFFLAQPDQTTIDQYREQQRTLPLSYNERQATRSRPPAGFDAAHCRVKLGHGRGDFEAACRALRQWRQFPDEMVTVHAEPSGIALGTHVVVRIRALGMWQLMCSEVVDVFDEELPAGEGTIRRFGFAYGTKPGHAERGEERFTVEWFSDDDSVWYDLRAFSRPQHWLVWLGLPYARHLQRKFATLSMKSMVRAVADARAAAVSTSTGRREEAVRCGANSP